jgi:hypothetical protein
MTLLARTTSAANFPRLPSLSDMAKCVDNLESMGIRVKSGKVANDGTEPTTRTLLAAQSDWLSVAGATRMADVLQPLARFCQVCTLIACPQYMFRRKYIRP